MIDGAYDARLKGLLGASGGGGAVEPGASLESLQQSAAAVRPAEMIDRVADNLNRVPDADIVDPDDFRRALDLFTHRAHGALRSVVAAPAAPLSRGDRFALEAIVQADGSRPSLLVRGDAVDWGHPLAGEWRGKSPDAASLKPLLAAVGRVEPDQPTSSSFFGTAWVIDQAKGLALTNLHVIEAMQRRLPNAMLRTRTGFRVLDGAFVDFAGEAGSARTARFKVVEATPSGIDGAGFARLDAAVLRLEPTVPGQALPQALPLSGDLGGALGQFDSLCLIGFPGPAPSITGVSDGVDWNWVNRTLFGGRYGVKRLAPGGVMRKLGGFGKEDPRGWVFGHDATTFGGSSGSAIIAWTGDGGAFGLHFAGRTGAYNCAHALAESDARQRLQALGVPFTL